MPKAKSTEVAVDVLEVEKEAVDFCILGTRPMICNRLSEKTKHELLMPAAKKNMAERATRLKHNPYDEFRASPHRFSQDDAETYLAIPASAFKRAMMTAALDLPGTKKAQIGRLTWVEGDYAAIYGVPQILVSPVRSADMNHTPDIRSRAIVPQWACRLRVTFIQPLMKGQAVVRLLAAAGLYIGIGDWRNEKGSGTFGSFELVKPDDPRFLAVISSGGRAPQVAAMDNPVAYDEESEEILGWFDSELTRRQIKGAA